MKFLQHLNEQQQKVLKIAVVAVIGLFVIVFVLQLLGQMNSARSLGVNPSFLTKGLTNSLGVDYAYDGEESTQGLSARNVTGMIPPYGNGSVGDDAEEFEVTEYYASIETRYLEDTCKEISDLKVKDYVIFENANESDKRCNYIFKVEHEHVEEVLSVIESFDPRDLNENTHTIKKLLDDYTSQTDILQSRLDAIDETLNNAISSYDEIARLATRSADAESLAKIIDSKVKIIERLTMDRININSQLERIGRAKAEQLDRLVYTYFNVSIIENVFVDGEYFKDSWKGALKSSVRDINSVVQTVTLSLVVTLFLIIQYAIYLLLLLVVAKYGWVIVKYIWNK